MSRKTSVLQRTYNRLRTEKSKFCRGTRTKAQVKTVANRYVKAAVRAGQTQAEARKKANRVLHGGCSKTSYIAKKKGKKKK